jgi:hypothetical protein
MAIEFLFRHGCLLETDSRVECRAIRTIQDAYGAWDNPNYCWVVICKNEKAHRGPNVMFGHKIPLGETDAFETPPIGEPFVVRCNDCGQEYSYEPQDVLRFELELPASFTPHPRFDFRG